MAKRSHSMQPCLPSPLLLAFLMAEGAGGFPEGAGVSPSVFGDPEQTLDSRATCVSGLAVRMWTPPGGQA